MLPRVCMLSEMSLAAASMDPGSSSMGSSSEAARESAPTLAVRTRAARRAMRVARPVAGITSRGCPSQGLQLYLSTMPAL